MPKGVVAVAMTTALMVAGFLIPTSGQTQQRSPGESSVEAAPDSGAVRPARESARTAAALSEIGQTFRDIAVQALADKPESVRARIISTKSAVSRLSKSLNDESYRQIETQLARMEELSTNGDRTGTALAANDAFRVVVNAINPAARRMPLEVALQSYSGLKLTILASAPEIDWAAIKLTAKDSERAWIKLRRSIRDTHLRVMLSEIQSGLNDAAARQDAAGVRFAARMQLASVAVLRSFYERFARAMARGR